MQVLDLVFSVLEVVGVVSEVQVEHRAAVSKSV